MNSMRRKHIILLIAFLILSGSLYFFRDSVVVRPITSFFQNSLSGVRAAVFSNTADDSSNLEEENRRLKEQISMYQTMERENEALRSQFENNETTEYDLVPARIIGYKGGGVSESFIIDAGKVEGVDAGMAVIIDNSLVGSVFEVSQNVSEVRTILHPDFSTIVEFPKTSARGIIRGFNSFVVMENVVITDTLEEGGIITTVGELDNQGIGIPSGISVGKIDSVDREETASFQTAQIVPLVNYSQISNVFVIKGL